MRSMVLHNVLLKIYYKGVHLTDSLYWVVFSQHGFTCKKSAIFSSYTLVKRTVMLISCRIACVGCGMKLLIHSTFAPLKFDKQWIVALIKKNDHIGYQFQNSQFVTLIKVIFFRFRLKLHYLKPFGDKQLYNEIITPHFTYLFRPAVDLTSEMHSSSYIHKGHE